MSGACDREEPGAVRIVYLNPMTDGQVERVLAFVEAMRPVVVEHPVDLEGLEADQVQELVSVFARSTTELLLWAAREAALEFRQCRCREALSADDLANLAEALALLRVVGGEPLARLERLAQVRNDDVSGAPLAVVG